MRLALRVRGGVWIFVKFLDVTTMRLVKHAKICDIKTKLQDISSEQQWLVCARQQLEETWCASQWWSVLLIKIQSLTFASKLLVFSCFLSILVVYDSRTLVLFASDCSLRLFLDVHWREVSCGRCEDACVPVFFTWELFFPTPATSC